MTTLGCAILLGSLLVLGGCGGDRVSGPATADLQPLVLDLRLYPTKEGLRAEAIVTNSGSNPVDYIGGCISGFRFQVLDAKGNELSVNCRFVEIACPGWGDELLPGETRTDALLFEGKMCGADGASLPVEPGWYQVVASFTYIESSELKQIEKRRAFRWR